MLYDEWFDRLQLKTGKRSLKNVHTACPNGFTLHESPPNTRALQKQCEA